MKTRIVSGLIMAPLLILVLIGGECITAACFIIAVMGIREFFNGFKHMNVNPSYPIAVVSIVLLYAGYIGGKYAAAAAGKYFAGNKLLLPWFVITIIMCLIYLFKIEERKLEDAMATMTGILYIGFFSYHAVLTENEFGFMCSEYVSPVWLILITAFCTDIFAYFGGYFLGKHKLCPVISPKKTIEGSICGILGSVAFTGLFAYFFVEERSLVVWFMVIGVLGGIISQIGDLTASIFKRKMGIKDYGNLIPGHGGILDRFDSVLFTAPMVYYSLKAIYVIYFIINVNA